MSSQNHFGRMRRLSNTSDMRNKTINTDQTRMTETIKLPALNAINKSVKYNDLSYATINDLKKLRKQPEFADDIEEMAAHNSLMSIRKKYDGLSKMREQREKSIQKMQAQKGKFQLEYNQYAKSKQDSEKKVVKLEEGLNGIKVLVDQSETEKKVMLNMISRIKQDKVVYDQRKFNFQKERVFLQKQKQIILKQNAEHRQEQDRTRKVYSKLMEHLQEQEKQRQEHLHNLSAMIEEQRNVVESSTTRQQEMKQIAQSTLQDKDTKQKNWYKVFLCHRFVQKLLRDKMTRQMIKFNTVEVAFKTIKTATGVNNGDTLVKKFLNKESAYGQLLSKIAENQRQISELKAENQTMNRERNKMKAEKAILNNNKIQSKDLSKEEKEMHYYSDKSQKCKLYLERLDIWLSRNIRKFVKLENKTAQVLEGKDSIGEVVGQFKNYIEKMLSTLNQVEDINVQDGDNLQSVENNNNFRVKVGEETEQKQKTMIDFDIDEEEFVNHQRHDLLRNNQKFMKEIHKKHEQLKKTKLQAEPKKKQISPEKPKQPPAQSI